MQSSFTHLQLKEGNHYAVILSMCQYLTYGVICILKTLRNVSSVLVIHSRSWWSRRSFTSPVSSLSSRKNFWLKMKATPLISSTLASAVVLRLTKFAVMAMASFPLNSFLLKPAAERGSLLWIQCWLLTEASLLLLLTLSVCFPPPRSLMAFGT